MLCPDFVDCCNECEGTLYFLMGTFCIHLTEKWGTSDPSLAWHIEMDHDLETPGWDSTWCDDNCVDNGWYSLEDVRNVVLAIRRLRKKNG